MNSGIQVFRRAAVQKLLVYWQLIKSLQTGLLLTTGLAGYMSARCPVFHLPTLLAMAASLFLTISGSTVLNMVWDSDIDALMYRTARRPLPSGQISKGEGAAAGGLLTLAGLIWAVGLDLRFGLVVAAGTFFDVLIYTIWLKRRTPYSILIGGLAGGMPALAGRVLAVGRIDSVGILLALGVLLWIPTHILTFSIKYSDDYARANVPTFPLVYGVKVTRKIVALSTFFAVLVLFAVGDWIGLSFSLLAGLGLLGLLLSALVFWSLFSSRPGLSFVLYKGASIYMLATMLLMIAGAIG